MVCPQRLFYQRQFVKYTATAIFFERGADAYCHYCLDYMVWNSGYCGGRFYRCTLREANMENVRSKLVLRFKNGGWWIMNCVVYFLIEIPCDRTTATLFRSYFTVNILSKNTRTLWPTTFWSMLVASRVNGNWHNTFCSSYMASFKSVWLQPKMLVGVRWDCGGHLMLQAVQWSRDAVVDDVFETGSTRSELVRKAHLADTPGKVNMPTVPLVRLGRTQQKCISRISRNDCAPKKLELPILRK